MNKSSHNLEFKVDQSIAHMAEIFSQQCFAPVVMLSFGKDSMTSLSLAMVAWIKACDECNELCNIPFSIIYADTKLEMPFKLSYIEETIILIQQAAKNFGIKIQIFKASPSVCSSWQGKVVGGGHRNFNVETTKGSACSFLWKTEPCKRLLKRIKNELEPYSITPVAILGLRQSESSKRNNSLTKRNSTSLSIECPNEHFEFYSIYPILDFQLTEVWDYLLFCQTYNPTGYIKLPGIADGFPKTCTYYNDLSDTECGISMGTSNCANSRDGCFLCMASNKLYLDSSTTASHPEVYPLIQFRRFLLENDNNLMVRNFLSTTLNDTNQLILKPTGYCGSYLLKILEIGLTIQKRELDRVSNLNQMIDANICSTGSIKKIEPFTLFSAEDIIFIDFSWGLRCLQLEPHAALKAFYRIFYEGYQVDIPDGYLVTTNSVPISDLSDYSPGVSSISFSELPCVSLFNSDSNSYQINKRLAEELLCKTGIEKCLTTNTDFMSAINYFLTSKLISPPSRLIKDISKKILLANTLYNEGYNTLAFTGGLPK